MLLNSKILGNPTDPSVLILHGFLGLSDNWRSIGMKIQELGYQIHLIDQRNHGKSFHADEFNYKLLAKDLKHYIMHHNLDKINIVGHSMGGKTVMRYVMDYPNKNYKFIVVDIAPKQYKPSHQNILKGVKAISQAQITSRNQATEILQQFIPDKPTQLSVLKSLHWEANKLKLCFNSKVLIEKYDEMLASPLSKEEQSLSNIWFIQGTKSNYITESEIPLLKNHFPNHKLEKINSGHWIHAEAPEELVEKITFCFKE